MFNAARPGSVVSLVVLRAEGLQAKPFGHKLTWHGEAIGNQFGSGHVGNLQPTPTTFRTIAAIPVIAPVGQDGRVVRRQYSVEDKERAVQAVATAGGRVAQVAGELGVPSSTVARWVREHEAADRVSAEARERAVRAVAAANGRVAPVARELGVPSSAVRGWILEHNAADWATLVAYHFRYLKRWGFQLSGADATVWEEHATFRSNLCAIDVIKDYQGPRVEVELMRLVDGELPEPEVFVVDSERVNRFYVDELIKLRQADGEDALARLAGMSTFDDQLKFFAAALRRVGADFLAGDLGVLDELERRIRTRVREHPQRVGVFLPDTAGDAEQSAAVALVRRTVPAEIDVRAGRYRTSRTADPEPGGTAGNPPG